MPTPFLLPKGSAEPRNLRTVQRPFLFSLDFPATNGNTLSIDTFCTLATQPNDGCCNLRGSIKRFCGLVAVKLLRASALFMAVLLTIVSTAFPMMSVSVAGTHGVDRYAGRCHLKRQCSGQT